MNRLETGCVRYEVCAVRYEKNTKQYPYKRAAPSLQSGLSTHHPVSFHQRLPKNLRQPFGSSAESGKKKINHIYAMAFQSSCAHVKSRDDQLHSGVPSIEQTYLVVLDHASTSKALINIMHC